MFYDIQLAARILKTVRDNKGIGMAALREKLGIPDQNLDSTDSTPVGDFEIILIDLIKCRLVEGISDEGKGEAIDIDGLPLTSLNGSIVFFPSKLVKKFQTIFGLSLSEIAKNPPGLSITSVPLFGPPERSTIKENVFVIMPFSEEMKPIYKNHIKKVVEECGMSCGRADDIFKAGDVMQDVWSKIYNSTIIIADCSGKNPNVFYELGISHTLGKRVVMIAQSMDDIPFDIAYLRCIVYRCTSRGMVEFEEKLHSALLESVADTKKRLVNASAAGF